MMIEGSRSVQKLGLPSWAKLGIYWVVFFGGSLKRHFSDLFLFLSTVQTIMTGTDKKKILWDLE